MPIDRNRVAPLPRPERQSAHRLDELAALVGGRVEGADSAGLTVTGITSASTQVRAGDLFAALPGAHVHGASFADEVMARGAVGVLTDARGAELAPSGSPLLLVDDVRERLGPVAAQVYGRPASRLDVLGVTGTSGKTTTTFLVRAALHAAGIASGLIGTVATLIGDDVLETGFTTPEAPDVQALLAVLVERGTRAVVMEVSSHALVLGRVGGIDFRVGAFTNLSQDHLDFHADMDAYFAAKARLFDGRTRRAVIVVDDDWGRAMAGIAAAAEKAGPGAGRGVGADADAGVVTVSTTGDPAATWRAVEVGFDVRAGTHFRALGPGVDVAAGCAVAGRYNVANALLALAIVHELEVDAPLAAAAIARASVPGRMERIEAGQEFLAVVDYSHKPAAVEGALHALRPLTHGRLIVVLGCGGDRDRAKRPLMGRVAASASELLLVTDDNPRSEDPAEIRRAVLAGAAELPAGERADVVEIGDRRAAIRAAVAAARPGDTVLVAGKGHETGQEIGGRVLPFDDRVVLRQAIEAAR